MRLDEMFRDYNGLVFRTAYRITGNAADAEDVLQTVFLRLSATASESGSPDKPEAYLRRAAVNASLDVVRARHLSRDLPLESAAAGATNPDDGSLRQALRLALASLKPQAAEIFTLRFIEGLSNGEIAETLGLNPVLVAVAVHRARKQLQNSLQHYLHAGKEASHVGA